jgi:hypothetical protein
MITTTTTANRRFAIEATVLGLDVLELALVNGDSEKVIALAHQLRKILDEVHDELYRTGAAQGFSPDEIDQAFHQNAGGYAAGEAAGSLILSQSNGT